MIQWEYKVEQVRQHRYGKPEWLADYLEQQGAIGWELCGIQSSYDEFFYIYKRPKPNPTTNG